MQYKPKLATEGIALIFNSSLTYKCDCSPGFWQLTFYFNLESYIGWKTDPQKCHEHEMDHLERAYKIADGFFREKSILSSLEQRPYNSEPECKKAADEGIKKFASSELPQIKLQWMHDNTIYNWTHVWDRCD